MQRHAIGGNSARFRGPARPAPPPSDAIAKPPFCGTDVQEKPRIFLAVAAAARGVAAVRQQFKASVQQSPISDEVKVTSGCVPCVTWVRESTGLGCTEASSTRPRARHTRTHRNRVRKKARHQDGNVSRLLGTRSTAIYLYASKTFSFAKRLRAMAGTAST